MRGPLDFKAEFNHLLSDKELIDYVKSLSIYKAATARIQARTNNSLEGILTQTIDFGTVSVFDYSLHVRILALLELKSRPDYVNPLKLKNEITDWLK